jgi:hypothetical protein
MVSQADFTGRYDWIPAPRVDDLTIALDGIAYRDLASRGALLFDELQSWEERSVAQRHVAELLVAIREHPAVATVERQGHPMIDFVEVRLRNELGHLWCGWRLANAGKGAKELICDPGAPPALIMGALAGLGLDPSPVVYAVPPVLPGSRVKRALARPAMRTLAAISKPERVRIAAVVAGKLLLALDSLPDDELRAIGLGAMPFPGLDHGNSALFALRRRLPLLATYGPRRAGRGPAVHLPDRLGVVHPETLDRAVTLLVGRLLAGAASEFARAVRSLAALERASSLRALVLPVGGSGASRLLIGWAHQRGLRVGVMQHGIYSSREVEGGERMTDVLFGWGDGTAEQTLAWPSPRPRVLPVGLPGVATTPRIPAEDPPGVNLSRVLIATTGLRIAPIGTTTYCDVFVDVIASGLERLVAAGVELELRPHHLEDAGRYRQLLDTRDIDVKLVPGGSFAAAAARTDILIASTSSVAFEAAALGLPVLLWQGVGPRWFRGEHLVPPWIEHAPGMFATSDEFAALVEDLLLRPEVAFELAHGLGRHLAHYAAPFRPDSFAAGLLEIAA